MTDSDAVDRKSISEKTFLALPEEERLAIAMRTAPRGAMTLAAIAVTVLMILWLAIYVFVFIPRGVTG